jgi:hypothetical protein
MRYSLLLHNAEPTEGQVSDERWRAMQLAFDAYAKSLDEAGVLRAAEIPQPVASTTTVTLRSGQLQVQDGPFADTKEVLGGYFLIDVTDLDAALAWAEKCPGAQYGVIEVRPAAISFIDGQWHS